jgi:hypothetical protein
MSPFLGDDLARFSPLHVRAMVGADNRQRNVAVHKPIASLCVFAISLSMIGCTHVQLKRNTVRQAWTVGDIQQQQVLNNLAKFVYDFNSLPSFSIPNQGGSNVIDAGNVGLTPGWSRFSSLVNTPFLFGVFGTTFGASRQAQESFTMTPINDPRKLELMRCAYQQAVSTCRGTDPSEHCPDCQTILKKFYTGDPDGDINAKSGGIVTSECLKGPCWFGAGCKKCVPKGCPCLQVGDYCGTWVWVLPGG